MPDQSIGILHERGSLGEASKKSDRYDEIGFTVVGFDQIKELK
jgi:hypothetical protein